MKSAGVQLAIRRLHWRTSLIYTGSGRSPSDSSLYAKRILIFEVNFASYSVSFQSSLWASQVGMYPKITPETSEIRIVFVVGRRSTHAALLCDLGRAYTIWLESIQHKFLYIKISITGSSRLKFTLSSFWHCRKIPCLISAIDQSKTCSYLHKKRCSGAHTYRMAYVGGESATWDGIPAVIRVRAVSLGLLGLLGIVVLNHAVGSPEWFVAWHITAAFLLFSGSIIVGRYLFATTSDSSSRPFLIPFQVLLLIGLIGITYQSRNPGYGLGIHRGPETWVVFFAVVTFCVLAGDPRRYTLVQWLVIGCFATVVGIFFYHSLSVAELSVRSRHPVWAGIIMGISLLVLPQYFSVEQFLWVLNRLAAVLVLLALPVYIIGEYSTHGQRY